jgi:hypothetical protein
MKASYKLCLALSVVAMPATVQAQQYWVPIGTPSNDGGQFWDNASWDGSSCNVGYILTGVAGSDANHACSNQRPVDWLPYGGETPTAFATNGSGGTALFRFTAGDYSFSSLAGALPGGDLAGLNQDWGYYLMSSGTYVSLNGGLPTGVQSMTEDWTIWVDLGNGGIASSSSSSQFALFGFGATDADYGDHWVVGIEDLGNGNGGSDWDYQDMLFMVSLDTPGTPQETVPEPATMTLLATGLAGLAASKRRRNRH